MFCSLLVVVVTGKENRQLAFLRFENLLRLRPGPWRRYVSSTTRCWSWSGTQKARAKKHHQTPAVDALVTPGIFWEISSLKPDEATHSFRLEAGNLAVANMKDDNWGLWGRSWEENPILSLWNCHFLLLSQLKFG